MLKTEVSHWMRRNGVPAEATGRIRDWTYARAAEDWVFGEFVTAWRQLQKDLGIADYTEESNDCDDQANGCAWFARTLHHRTPTRPKKTGLAVCDFEYHPTQNAPDLFHVITGFLVGPPNDVRLVFLEPNGATRLILTPEEKASCVGYFF